MMAQQNGNGVAQTGATETEPAQAPGRREFVARLAKAAIVPAVIAGMAANTVPAHARP